MTSSAAISILQPKLQFFPCRFCPLKSFKPKFPISKLAFSGGLDPKKAPSRRNRVMGSNNSIVELTNLLPFRNNGDEAVRVLQHGSEDSGLVSNRFESTLNRLSKWLVSGIFAVVILCRHDEYVACVWYSHRSLLTVHEASRAIWRPSVFFIPSHAASRVKELPDIKILKLVRRRQKLIQASAKVHP